MAILRQFPSIPQKPKKLSKTFESAQRENSFMPVSAAILACFSIGADSSVSNYPVLLSEIIIVILSLLIILILYRGYHRNLVAKRELDVMIESLLDSIDEIPLDVAPNGEILGYKEKIFRALGYDREEGTPENIFDMVNIEDKPIFQDTLELCANSGRNVKLIGMRLNHNDGGTLYYNIVIIAGNRMKGSIQFCKLILQNITEKKALSERLREKEVLYDTLVRQTLDGVLLIENEKILFVNRSFSEMVGIGFGQAINKNIREFIHPDNLAKFDEWISNRKAIGVERALLDTQLARASGDRLSAELDFTTIRLPEKTVELVVVRDISEISTHPEMSGDEKFRLLFENTNDAIFFSNMFGRIVQFNPAAETLTGFSAEELENMSIHDLFYLDDRELSLRQLSWIKRGNRVHFESHFIIADGSRIDVDISGNLVKIGEEEFMINIVRDITERKRFLSRISQTQKIESLGVMAGGVAHDFNNILEGIIGAAELAKEMSSKNQELMAYINLIAKSAEKGANLTKHLLGYAQTGEIEFEILDLNNVAIDAKEFLSHTLNKRINLRLEIARDLKPIWGDPSRLKQVIVNLALNAQDAMPEGGELLVETRNFSVDERFAIDHIGLSPGPHIELTVQDTGAGIAPEILPKIFDPFFTTKERGEGTGLGLAIVQSIVHSHSGAIDVKSRLHEGTSIKIYFPTISAMVESFDKPTSLETMSGRGKRIMVIDDEEIIQTVLSGILNQLGYRTFQARSGKEGIELLTAGNEADAVLLDMVMPGLSGWETYRYLRTYWPRIPVIVITGYANQEQIRAMLEDGLAGIVEKPFRAAQIAEKLKQVLEN